MDLGGEGFQGNWGIFLATFIINKPTLSCCHWWEFYTESCHEVILRAGIATFNVQGYKFIFMVINPIGDHTVIDLGWSVCCKSVAKQRLVMVAGFMSQLLVLSPNLLKPKVVVVVGGRGGLRTQCQQKIFFGEIS